MEVGETTTTTTTTMMMTFEEEVDEVEALEDVHLTDLDTTHTTPQGRVVQMILHLTVPQDRAVRVTGLRKTGAGKLKNPHHWLKPFRQLKARSRLSLRNLDKLKSLQTRQKQKWYKEDRTIQKEESGQKTLNMWS
jgi:hypothetical protein